jgi:hypothetical protein
MWISCSFLRLVAVFATITAAAAAEPEDVGAPDYFEMSDVGIVLPRPEETV